MKYLTADKKLLSIAISVMVSVVLLAFSVHDPVFAVEPISTLRIGGTGGADGSYE